MVFGERREEVGRRQLLLAGLEVQLIAARRILGDGDDRCFTVFALVTLNTLLALFTGIALLALRPLNTLLSLRSRTAAVALHTLWTDLALNMQEDKEAVLEELPLALLRQYSERFDEDVYAAIALTNCVTGRTSLGGTCVASVEAQIASVRDFLAGQTEAAKQAKNG